MSDMRKTSVSLYVWNDLGVYRFRDNADLPQLAESGTNELRDSFVKVAHAMAWARFDGEVEIVFEDGKYAGRQFKISVAETTPKTALKHS